MDAHQGVYLLGAEETLCHLYNGTETARYSVVYVMQSFVPAETR